MNNKRRYAPRKPSRSGHNRPAKPGPEAPKSQQVRRRPVRNLITIEEFASQGNREAGIPLGDVVVNTGAPVEQKPDTRNRDTQSAPEKNQGKGRSRKRKTHPEPQQTVAGARKPEDRKKAGGHKQPTRKPVPRLVPRPVSQRKHEEKPGRPIETTGAFSLLIPPIQRALQDSGYEEPTPIQAQAIPHLLEGRDILGCAQTGTGKTAAFTLPILQYLNHNPRRPEKGHPRVLVLAPTRELAAQIDDSIRVYGKHLKIFHAVIFGGVSQVPQVKKLQRGLDILVATPGRLLDLMQQGHLTLSSIEVFVLDEADRMLDMGFLPDIRKVIAKLPDKRHSLFFSATLSDQILELARTLVRNPVEITVTPEQPTVEKIDQKLMFVGKRDKTNLLIQLLQGEDLDKVIVFTRMKFMANRVAQKLNAAGISAMPIHGNKSQTARTQALDSFRNGSVRVLVATDIAARGIDVDNITHVINYDLPNEPETYVHRIGRTARAGAEGDAVSFCSAEERAFLKDIERLIRQRIPIDRNHPFHGKEEVEPDSEAGKDKPGRPRGRFRRRR